MGSKRRARLSPEAEAIHSIVSGSDKPCFKVKWIDDYKGMLYTQSTIVGSYQIWEFLSFKTFLVNVVTFLGPYQFAPLQWIFHLNIKSYILIRRLNGSDQLQFINLMCTVLLDTKLLTLLYQDVVYLPVHQLKRDPLSLNTVGYIAI